MTVISSPLHRWRVGEVEITRVLEFEAALFEPAVLYPEVSLEVVRRHRGWLEPTLMDPASGLLVLAFHSTVIRTPRATILVDTCSGNDKERPHKLRYHRKHWPYLTNLATAGFAPEDIDYVLCTHLHADHQIPIEQRPDLRLDLDNLRTRCNRCHNAKSMREMRVS